MNSIDDPLAFLDRTEIVAPPRSGVAPQVALADELHGFYYDMDFDTYAAAPGLNGSKILSMRRSPMAYRWAMQNPKPPTPALEMGALVHRMVWEPEKVGTLAVWGEKEDQKVRRGKVWDKFREEHEGEIILTEEQANTAIRMSSMAMNNAPIARYARAKGPTEVSLFWRHPFTGRQMKARLDKIIAAEHIIADLKTTRDCHSYRFGGQAYSLGYHCKMAHYAQGYEALTGVKPSVVLCALDSNPPHEGAVYRVTPDVLAQGMDELTALVAKIEECEQSKNWPGEYEEETDLILPQWAQSFENSEFEIEDTM